MSIFIKIKNRFSRRQFIKENRENLIDSLKGHIDTLNEIITMLEEKNVKESNVFSDKYATLLGLLNPNLSSEQKRIISTHNLYSSEQECSKIRGHYETNEYLYLVNIFNCNDYIELCYYIDDINDNWVARDNISVYKNNQRIASWNSLSDKDISREQFLKKHIDAVYVLLKNDEFSKNF